MNKQDLPNLEYSLNDALEALKSVLPEKEFCEIREYLEFGEYGVAYDLLVFMLEQSKTTHPSELVAAKKIMELGHN